ncbi:MAG TPA: hypothetical protein DEG44_02680 [Candidatus Kerfeldbacteria bacterium]|nr:hypothetical protein [Candidatus Kerfeldbacteria bacterium]
MVQCDVRLVFDRGFACPSIVKFLNRYGVKFIIRIKRTKHVLPPGSALTVAVHQLLRRSTRVSVYGCDLRIVRSTLTATQPEPWYLVTNDLTTPTDDIITSYYHRFEIEEWFKDVKRLAGLEYLHQVSDTTFTLVLWFMLLGVWVLWLTTVIRKAWQRSQTMIHRHHRLSFMKYWWEQMNYERNRIVYNVLNLQMG